MRVASAIWTMKNVSTEEGQKLYGPNFWNHDDLVVMHACAVRDPRCDQGHFGPQFMTFHRLYVLKWELSLLSVDPTIEAMPYWDISADSSNGKYRNDPDKYIFTENYFGSYQPTDRGYKVVDGLFAHWPIVEYTEDRFGSSSPLASVSTCIAKEYWKPKPASVCTRCCNSLDPRCKCTDDDDYPTLLRGFDNCIPTLVRNPSNNPLILGSNEIVFSEEDFNACADPTNTPSWMAWQNCIEISRISCSTPGSEEFRNDPGSLERVEEFTQWALTQPRDVQQAALSTVDQAHDLIETNCSGNGYSVSGYYTSMREKVLTDAFHSQVHTKLSLDFGDISTSPNDAAAFFGYHSDLDRSNMQWMEQSGFEDQNWRWPDGLKYAGGTPPYGTSGPYSIYAATSCFAPFYDEYNPEGGPWLNGTFFNDVVTSNFPFFNLFECDNPSDCDGGNMGYTHNETLFWSSPERTPYTYDTLAHLYYD
eukprot:CAMPEP_0201488550 /NCGR_PEP_ID=MMETSP0151_2-20130828/18868_1 /ASSEMBLY_ACC=CAM_ASM_000257 /TAXON_ID=200890 /ORGANISM="Paramoeba atlantica, Strain 621/1 / CCAP 1560/9" /LENGTH=475 /DNA_ID=CAMNT_0047873865 /DNA_START=169 /DNA_END=1596 /DNA_ORIENTATION=-